MTGLQANGLGDLSAGSIALTHSGSFDGPLRINLDYHVRVVGTNSTVRNGVRIRKGSVVGAGALILRDTEEFGVYKGRAGELLPKKSYEINL